MSKKNEFSRLPKSIIPANYNLWLKPSLEEFVFDGQVDIELDIFESSREIVLNCAEITISSATFRQKGKAALESSDIQFQVRDEKVSIRFSESLAVGKGVLSIIFKGELNDKMRGFYRSRYFLNKETRFGAVTQFEATDARRCFPCWDEPALKATFDVTLVVPKNKVALSNMNVIHEEVEEAGDFKVVKYARTPIMSTYLLAFAIGDFDFVEGRTGKGLPVRVYTPTGKSEQGQFALDVALKALLYYEDYFKIPYPLPKLDLIAIADFQAGAMENWGLVTYRETALLIDEANSSAQSRQHVSIVVCHELAHQWFGNLVTMEWWTHLWLNEGFASFMQYLATDHCHPEFDIWTQFVSKEFMRGIELDALDNSHPIEVPVGHPDEIGEIFDAISYSKGASIIRMLHNWIGDDCFRQGMNKYLTKHAYKNAFTEDLWGALEEASGKPVGKVMESWTKQMGFPVVHAEVLSRSDSSITLRLSQKKFRARAGTAEVDSSMWYIPIAFCSAESPDKPVKSILLEEAKSEVTLQNVSRKSWIKINPGMYGFYRVQYEPDLLNALLPAVERKSLQSRDRLGFENDLFALAGSGMSPTTDFLQALTCYKAETNYTVWSDLDSNINSLSILLWSDVSVLNNFKKVVLSLYDATSSSLGWDPRPRESHLDAMLRSLMKHRTGKYGCQKTVAEARERFNRHLSKTYTVGADLRSAVYETVLVHGGSSELDQLLDLHDTAELHEEKERIERSLGCVSDDELMSRVFDFALSDEVRSNDKVFVIGSVAANSPSGRDRSWEFVKANWTKLYKLYKGTTFMLSRLVKSTTENFGTQEKADEVIDFFQTHPAPGTERAVQQSVENIRRRCEWWMRDGKSISEWISANSA